MNNLSPVAQAVLNAFKEQVDLTWLTKDHDQIVLADQLGLAAALRAVALYCTRERRILMTIADELEGSS